jgi:hypothetical protein
MLTFPYFDVVIIAVGRGLSDGVVVIDRRYQRWWRPCIVRLVR